RPSEGTKQTPASARPALPAPAQCSAHRTGGTMGAANATLLLVFDFRKLRVDHLLVAFLRAARAARIPGGGLGLALRLGIHRLAQLLRRSHQRLRLRFQGI